MKRCLADRWDVNVIPEGTGQSTKLGIWSFLAVRKQSVVFFFLQGFKFRFSVLERLAVFMYKENIPLTDYTIRTLRVSIVPIFTRS